MNLKKKVYTTRNGKFVGAYQHYTHTGCHQKVVEVDTPMAASEPRQVISILKNLQHHGVEYPEFMLDAVIAEYDVKIQFEPVVEDWGLKVTRKIKVVVACTNASGIPELLVISLKVTEDQIKEGEHYDMASEKATLLGYEPKLCFDHQEINPGMLMKLAEDLKDDPTDDA